MTLKPKYNLDELVVFVTCYASIHHYTIRHARIVDITYKQVAKAFEYTVVDIHNKTNYYDKIDEKDIFPEDAKLIVEDRNVYVKYVDCNVEKKVKIN